MKANLLRYGLAYILWFVIIGISVLVAMAVRDTFRFMVDAAGWHRYTVHASSQFLTLILVLGLVIYLVVVEHLFRTAVPKQKLMPRFFQLTGWSLVTLAVMHLLQGTADFVSSGFFDGLRFAAGLVELLIGLLFLWLQNRVAGTTQLSS